MNKKLLGGSIVFLLVVSTCLYFFIDDQGEKMVIIDDKSNQVINSDTLTMMYETEASSGEYQISSDSEWPQDGYVFNEILSKCENGSTLTWNDESKEVVVQANVSDKCYVYFDKEKKLISFTIGEHYMGIIASCTALPNMTWEQWIGSEYDTCNLLKLTDDNYVHHITGGKNFSCPLNYPNSVEKTSIILDGGNYFFNSDYVC